MRSLWQKMSPEACCLFYSSLSCYRVPRYAERYYDKMDRACEKNEQWGIFQPFHTVSGLCIKTDAQKGTVLRGTGLLVSESFLNVPLPFLNSVHLSLSL